VRGWERGAPQAKEPGKLGRGRGLGWGRSPGQCVDQEQLARGKARHSPKDLNAPVPGTQMRQRGQVTAAKPQNPRTGRLPAPLPLALFQDRGLLQPKWESAQCLQVGWGQAMPWVFWRGSEAP
jgi:hypothetical protein